MQVDALFPSKYVKASDLNGKPVTVTISHIAVEDVGQQKEKRPVIYFYGAQKGMVLNKTNATIIGKMHGPDIRQWGGKEITLAVAQVEYQGNLVDGIRVQYVPPPPTIEASAFAPPTQAISAPMREVGTGSSSSTGVRPHMSEMRPAAAPQQTLAQEMNDSIPF